MWPNKYFSHYSITLPLSFSADMAFLIAADPDCFAVEPDIAAQFMDPFFESQRQAMRAVLGNAGTLDEIGIDHIGIMQE